MHVSTLQASRFRWLVVGVQQVSTLLVLSDLEHQHRPVIYLFQGFGMLSFLALLPSQPAQVISASG